ncbi:MAG: hypothetical protein RM021_033205 [Nostoc sp. EkiNYC01]|nr:hypothetical protein [Nostoc sp. EkiNYC01]
MSLLTKHRILKLKIFVFLRPTLSDGDRSYVETQKTLFNKIHHLIEIKDIKIK